MLERRIQIFLRHVESTAPRPNNTSKILLYPKTRPHEVRHAQYNQEHATLLH